MKNTFKILIFTLLCLVCLRILLGIVFHKQLQPDVFTVEDLPPLDLSTDNGYFKVWALNEPLDVDINDPKVIAQYQKLFDPTQTSIEKLLDWYQNTYKKKSIYKNFVPIHDILSDIWKSKETNKLLIQLEKNIENFEQLNKSLLILMDRYDQIINSSVLSVISFPQWEINPSLSSFLELTKFYITYRLTKIFSGQWEDASLGLIKIFNAGRQMISTSRIYISHVTAKVMMIYSLDALTALTQHPHCPKSIQRQILNRITLPLRYNELAPESLFIGWYIGDKKKINEKDHHATWTTKMAIDKNYSNQKLYSFSVNIMRFEGFPSQKWPFDSANPNDVQPEPYWHIDLLGIYRQFSNYYSSSLPFIIMPNFSHTLKGVYEIRVKQDLLLLSNELRLKLDPDDVTLDQIKLLENYKKKDPFDGKSYVWDQQKKVFYSDFLKKFKIPERSGNKRRKRRRKR